MVANSFAERLDAALTYARVTKPDLAKALGISIQAVNKVFSGTTKALTAENTARASAFLRVDLFWLATGAGGPAVKPLKDGDGESAQAHWLSQAKPIMAPPNLSWEFLMSKPLPQLPPYFILTMRDDAIAPVAPKGRDYLFSAVEDAPPRPADVVLVVDAAGQPFVRIYESGRGEAWRAVALTTGYSALDSEADSLDVVAIGMAPWGRRG